MSDLSKHMRDALPKKDFAGPGRSFPVENKDHAEAALMDAPKAERKGDISKSQEKRIDSKAHKELKK